MNPTTRQIDRELPYVAPQQPMPLEEYERKALEDFAQVFAAFTLMSLLFTGAVWPWNHEIAALPFFVAFVGGMWVLAGGKQ